VPMLIELVSLEIPSQRLSALAEHLFVHTEIAPTDPCYNSTVSVLRVPRLF
jgi:hypothetical protein